MSTPGMHVHHPLDLRSIDAVGFDLDHTLALYDDAEVNRIATAGACRLLVERRRYPEALLGPIALEMPAAGRTLAADLVHGAVVKLAAGRRAIHGRLLGRWLSAGDIRDRYPGDVADDPTTAYSIYSPFSLPVLWLMDAMETLAPIREGRAQRCEDIRHMLDLAHTNGTLKHALREDLPRFVSGIPGLRASLERWKSAGKRLFVVTNSEADFAPGVLDIAVGRGWDGLFDIVVMNARKPAFFREGARDLEAQLGSSAERVLYVGDNTRSDILAARDHGWRTVQVVPEMDARHDDAWGHPLTHDGTPTWLSERIRAADAACAHAGVLLALDPRAAMRSPAPQGLDTP